MKKLFSQNKKGVTLIELMIYVAIMALLIGSITSFYSIIHKSEIRNQAAGEVEIESAQIINFIQQSVRNSTSVSSPLPGSTAPSLSVQVTDAAKNPTIFSLTGGNIFIKEGASAPVQLNSAKISLTNLAFRNLGDLGTKGSLRLQFKAAFINPGNNPDKNYSKTFYGSASLR